MNYTSTNIFSDFEFHDAYFKLESLKDNVLILSAQHLNLHKNTAQNPYDTDMEISIAQITFNNFHVLSFNPGGGWEKDGNGNWHLNEPPVVFEGKAAEEKLLDELQAGTTVLEFGTLENGTPYFDGAGVEPWFQLQFSFEAVEIQWDEFRQQAWYEISFWETAEDRH